MVNEENLVKELKRGNIKALNYIVDNHSNLLFKVSYSVLNNRQLSEECVNDILLKAWNGVNNFNGNNEQLKKWLMVMAKYTAIDMLRREAKYGKNISLEDLIEIKVDDLESKVESNEVESLLRKEIDKMDKTNKEIFERRFLKGEKIKEIGIHMKLSESSINNRLLRGKRKLINVFKGGVL